MAPTSDNRGANTKLRMIVLSPWGVGGGYSGPLTLLDRLLGAVKAQYDGSDFEIDILARNRGNEVTPKWASEIHYVGASTAMRFGVVEQLRWSFGARRFLRKTRGRYDVVHLHGAYIVNQLAVVFAGLGPSTVVLPVLENGDLASAGNMVARLVKRLISRSVVSSAKVGYALSPRIAAELKNLGMPADRIEHLGNVVDMKKYEAVVQQAQGPIRLGFVGKLGPIKRPHLVVEAIAILNNGGTPTIGTFVGPFASNEYEEQFWSEVGRLGVREFVNVVGFVNDAAPYLQHEMDVFVLPSRSEGLPGALAEAMASGIPCLVTDVGAMARVVQDAGSGFVIRPEPSEVVDTIKLLVTDPALRQRLGAAGRSYAAQHFSSEVVARTYSQRSFHRTVSDDLN